MNKKELNNNLKQAQEAESAANFFNAAHYYKEALGIARNLGDSSSIKLCKNKVIEMNQKSQNSFKEICIETKISNKEIDTVINFILDGDLDAILEMIGIHPFLSPKIKQVEESALKNISIYRQIANVSTISKEGHLIKGGSDSDYSQIMQTYDIQQSFIVEFYLEKIFKGLTNKGFNKESLVTYLRSRGIFPESNLSVITVGIERYFAGDYVSALHILIPQFENVFLFISKKLGIDVIALNRSKEISTQNKTLSLEHLSSDEFQNKWGRDFCEQLKFALFEPLGYTLRHKIAHGQINLEECTQQKTNLILYFFLVLAAKIRKEQ
jgi:hypothetical protein